MTNTENSRRKDDARPAETLHWDAACSICAGDGTTFGKTCVCRAAEAKRLTLTDTLRQAARDLLEHNAAAGACIEIPGEPSLYVLVGAASAIGKLLPEAALALGSTQAATGDVRDAARYRWLRDPVNIEGPNMVAVFGRESLDTAIDAAIMAAHSHQSPTEEAAPGSRKEETNG